MFLLASGLLRFLLVLSTCLKVSVSLNSERRRPSLSMSTASSSSSKPEPTSSTSEIAQTNSTGTVGPSVHVQHQHDIKQRLVGAVAGVGSGLTKVGLGHGCVCFNEFIIFIRFALTS